MKKFFSLLLCLCFLYSFVFSAAIEAAVIPLGIPVGLELTSGKINGSFLPNNEKPQIIFIQDLHTSSSVQKNISNIIEDVSKTYQIDKVLVEGMPYRKIDSSFITNLSKFNVTENLLESGLLSATEYYLLTKNKNIEIFGLENWDMYFNNIQRAALILKDKKNKAELFLKFKKALYKKIPYNKKLMKYVDFNLNDFNIISKMNQPILQFDNLQKYYRLSKNNKLLDLKQVTKEHKHLLRFLKNNISFEQYNEIISLSTNNINQYNKMLYAYLVETEELKNKYKNLYEYLYNNIKIKELNNVSLIEQKNKYFDSFLKDGTLNKRLKQSLFVLKMTEIFETFLNLAITEQDYKFFKANYKKYLNLISQYLSADFNKYSALFYTVELFNYNDENIKRNSVFVNNILNSLKQNNSKTNIVIAGGFHTSVLEQLEKQNISYLMITPSVKNDTDNAVYNEIIESTFEKQALAKIPLMLETMEEVPLETRFLYLIKVIKTVAEDNYSVNNIENIVSKLSVENFPLSCKYSNDKFTICLNVENKPSMEFDVYNGTVVMDNKSEKTNTKQIIITTDIHAGYSRWLQLFIYQLEPQLQNKDYLNLEELYNELLKNYPQYKNFGSLSDEKIEKELENIVIDIIQNKEGTKFYVLGDLLDRGDKPVETFNFIKRISETGKLEFVIGNHDLYAFMNLLGLHLPFYENYKGIPDSYEVIVAGNKINIQELLKNKRQQKDKTVNSKIYWAKILADYMQYADERQNKIWTPMEQNLQQLFMETFSNEFTDEKSVDMLHNPTGIFAEDEILLNFHKKFFGRNVGTTVYTGIRAVDKMSINWWLERKQELEFLSNKYPQYQKYWYQLNGLIDTIISEQQQMMNEQYKKGNWQWLVVDAIMFGNYQTTHWNGLDWAYHAKWGSQDRGFIGYRDEQLKAENKKGIDNVSYLEDSLFREMAEFYKNNFYLYKIDDNGICYMHSVLPVDDELDVAIGYVDKDGNLHTDIKGFIYKGIHYEGINLLKGFDVIAEDIRNYDISSNDLSQIQEALTIVTSIYADNTTKIKPANVKEMKQAGFEKIFSKIGLGTVVVGHNPIEKLDKQNVNQIEYVTVNIFNFKLKIPILINSDRSMSKGYKNQGLARNVTDNGVETLYFKDGDTYNVSKTKDVNSTVFSVSKFYNKLLVPLLNIVNVVEDTQKINKNNSLIITPLSIDENCSAIKDIKGIEYLDKLHTQKVSSVGLVISDKKLDENLVETSTLLDKKTIKFADTEIDMNIYLNKFDISNGTVDVIWIEYETEKTANENIQNIIKQEIFNNIIQNGNVYNFNYYKNILFVDNNNLFAQVKPKDIGSKMLETLFDTFGVIPPLAYIDRLNVVDDINKENPSEIIFDMLSAA